MVAITSRIIARVRQSFKTVVTVIRRHPKKSIVAAAIVLGMFLFAEDTAAPVVEEGDTIPPTVTVRTVASLSADTEPLVLLGEVRSVSQAELRTQSSGEVTRVNVTAGQRVSAGTILAELDNAAERAAVLSAQGSLAAAEASLARVYAGARAEDRASVSAQADSATIARATAEENARTVYSQSYSLTQDAVFAKADTFFTNAYTARPSFRVRSATYDERRVLENERVAIGELLDDWKERTLAPLPADELDVVLAQAHANLSRVKTFLDSISVFVSKQDIDDDFTATEKAAQEALLLGARSSIDGARASVAGARQGLASAQSAEIAAQSTESKVATGDRPEDVRIAEASVMSARGAYAGALAGLERTLIRTPIAGTVVTFNINRGDFVSQQSVVAVVANPSALEIEAFVSDQARERLATGMPVTIDGLYDGVVTSVAPGLDPVTKKARVTVSVPDDATLVNGAFVEIALASPADDEGAVASRAMMVPITAVKVLPRGFAVFTVEDGVLVARSVPEGPIVGTKMLITDGVTPDTAIVTDVRGLAEGDAVTVTY